MGKLHIKLYLPTCPTQLKTVCQNNKHPNNEASLIKLCSLHKCLSNWWFGYYKTDTFEEKNQSQSNFSTAACLTRLFKINEEIEKKKHFFGCHLFSRSNISIFKSFMQ